MHSIGKEVVFVVEKKMIYLFLLIIICIQQCRTCYIQTENCTCNNENFYFNMDCLEDQLSFENDLDFGQLKIEQSNKYIVLRIKNKFINQIKTLASESDYSQLIVSLTIENCKMKELKANSFEKMISLIELIINNDQLEIS